MTAPICPKCRKPIAAEDVNVGSDVAFCRACNAASRLSELIDGTAVGEFDAAHPPRGAWVRGGVGDMVLGASHRSVAGAIGLLFVSVFWNGITSVFVLLALSSTLRHLKIAAPAWFPAPEMDGGDMPLGLTIFLWLFLTPFILIGLAMFAGFFNCLGGRTEVRIGHGEGSTFSGIGPLGWTRRFNPHEVGDVRLHDKRWRDSDGDARRTTRGVIVMRDGKEIVFGQGLPMERLRFLVAGAKSAVRSLGGI